MTTEAQIAVLKAQREAHEDRHAAFEKSIDEKMDVIRKQHETCRSEVKAELEAGHQEFKNLRTDVQDIKSKVNLIYANGHNNWRKEWTIRVGTGGGALAIILFLIQFLINNW